MLRVVGLSFPDDTWRKMRAVYDACEDAGLSVPSKVLEYFDYKEPNERGLEINLTVSDAVREDMVETREVVEIELSKIPANITVLRVEKCP